jgi:hypothetical protein
VIVRFVLAVLTIFLRIIGYYQEGKNDNDDNDDLDDSQKDYSESDNDLMI